MWVPLPKEIFHVDASTQRDTFMWVPLPKEILSCRCLYPKRYFHVGASTQEDTFMWVPLPEEILLCGCLYPKRYFHVGVSTQRDTFMWVPLPKEILSYGCLYPKIMLCGCLYSKIMYADETVYEERGDKVKRAATTAASLDAEQDSEDAEIQERYGHDTEINNASTSITTASINILTDEPVTTVSAPITSADVYVNTVEPSTPSTTVIEDKDLTISHTLMKMRCEKSKEKAKERISKAKERKSKEKSSKTATRPTRGVIIKEASETTIRPTVPPQQKFDPKDKGKGKMVEPEKPLKKKVQIELDEKIMIYLKDYKHNSKENCLLENRAEGSETRAEGSSKKAREKLESNKFKKQKLDEKVEAEEDNDQEASHMKWYMKIVPDDEIINREDLETLWKLVKAKYGNTRPKEAYERVLWGDLKVMFEPDIESEAAAEHPLHGSRRHVAGDSCNMSLGKTIDEPTFSLTENVAGLVLSPGKRPGIQSPWSLPRRSIPCDMSLGKTIPDDMSPAKVLECRRGTLRML
uniref:Uncharacterized protein n=1 Tax=Tanacetum cinerariifolium TaxID=118510 RepID=A0A6L2KGF8_TANCI|nr:hypothetical protein [Tanacetum cinerariifolium]